MIKNVPVAKLWCKGEKRWQKSRWQNDRWQKSGGMKAGSKTIDGEKKVAKLLTAKKVVNRRVAKTRWQIP